MAKEDHWKAFAYWCAGGFGAAMALAALLLVLFDPYHNIPFAPPFERHYMENNQRYMYPALARDPRFNSTVLGTSAVRMLPPERLDEGFGANFSYLALDAGTPWEQLEIAKLFYEHHPAAEVVIYGVDRNWCASPEPHPRLTRRPFPPWMFDDNPYNDLLYLMNGKSLEIATRQLRYYLGLDITRYDANGFEDFLPPDEAYDLHKAQANIYGDAGPEELDALAAATPGRKRGWSFPDHALFREFLAITPETTRLVIVYPPHHAYLYLTHKERFDACKEEITALAREIRPDAAVLDLMLFSSLTGKDENYWDNVHFNRASADRIARLIVEGAATGKSGEPDIMTVRRWGGVQYGAGPGGREAGPAETGRSGDER